MECAFGVPGSNEGEFFENAIPEIQPLPWKKISWSKKFNKNNNNNKKTQPKS